MFTVRSKNNNTLTEKDYTEWHDALGYFYTLETGLNCIDERQNDLYIFRMGDPDVSKDKMIFKKAKSYVQDINYYRIRHIFADTL